MGGYSKANDLPVGFAFQKPEIYLGSPSPAIFIEGQDLVLTAAAVGGNIKYQWYSNGEAIEGANKNVLLLHGVQKNRSGVLSLVASNELGETEVKIKTEIISPPNDITKIKNLYQSSGGKAVLGKPYSLAVTVPDGARFRWYKNEQPIVNASTHRIYFNEIKRSDAGTYTVKIMTPSALLERKMVIKPIRELDSNDST